MPAVASARRVVRRPAQKSLVEQITPPCSTPTTNTSNRRDHGSKLITAGQIRVARRCSAWISGRSLRLCPLSVPTIQRMEASEGVIRGHVDSLMKLIAALG
jgi:hypothetical protein